MKKLIVSDKCVACGSCVMMCDLLVERSDGKAVAKEPSTISEQQLDKVKAIINSCPVKAISIEESGLTKAKGKEGLKELANLIDEKMENCKETLLSLDGYRFNKSEYIVPVSGGTGEYRYEYKSDSKAMQAGLKDFDRVMYSQRKALIQQVLVDYKHRQLKKYAYYEKKSGNYYYDTNKRIQKAIAEFIAEAKELSSNKIVLPSGFEKFEVIPDFGYDELMVYKLRHFDELWFVDNIIRELERLSWYDTYVDTDDCEGSRGRYMYCYKNIYKVCELFGKHILNEVEFVLNSYDGVGSVLKGALSEYIKDVENEISNKVGILKNAIDSVVSGKYLEYNCKSKKVQQGKNSNGIFKNGQITISNDNYIFTCPNCNSLKKIEVNIENGKLPGKDIYFVSDVICPSCNTHIKKVKNVTIHGEKNRDNRNIKDTINTNTNQIGEYVFSCPNYKCGSNIRIDSVNCIKNENRIEFKKEVICYSCGVHIKDISISCANYYRK